MLPYVTFHLGLHSLAVYIQNEKGQDTKGPYINYYPLKAQLRLRSDYNFYAHTDLCLFTSFFMFCGVQLGLCKSYVFFVKLMGVC